MTEKHRQLAERVAERYCQLPQVEAVVIGGSLATGNASPESDIDLYGYLTADIGADERLALAREFAVDAKMNDFWGPGNEWIDPQTKIQVDMMFWTTEWIEDQIERVLARHEAWVGYSTCFWHTVRHSRILFDRNGWFKTLQTRST